MTLSLPVVFFLSGGVALVYQVVWQRILFANFGLDVLSTTFVVSAFMLGLGAGGLVGGALSRKLPGLAVTLFALTELGLGIFGLSSIYLFHVTAAMAVGASHAMTGLISFGLLLIPTALMGATLPLHVGYATSINQNVGQSVSWLYFANTLGGAVGAYFAVEVLFQITGLSGAVKMMAFINLTLGAYVVVYARARTRAV